MGNKSDNKQGKSTSAMKQLLPLVAAGIVAVIAATGCLYAYQASQLQPEQQNAQARLLAQSLASQASNTIQTYGYDSVTAMQETKSTLCRVSPA